MKKALLCISIFSTVAHVALAAKPDKKEKQERLEQESLEDEETYCGCGCNELSEDCPMKSRSPEQWEDFNDRFPEYNASLKPTKNRPKYPQVIDLAYESCRAKSKKQ
jgi:hypothetical protein